METIQSLVFPHLNDQQDNNITDNEEDNINSDNNEEDFIKQRKRRASLVSHQSSSNDSLLLYHHHPSSAELSSPSIANTTSSFLNEESNGMIINKLDALKSNISWKTITSNRDGLTRTQRTWLVDIESLLKVRGFIIPYVCMT
jgi:hypothetical protein